MIRRIIVYLFATLLFFTPLILWPSTFELFEFNKMVFVYLLAALIAGLWMARCITEKKFVFRRTPLDLPLLLFLLSQILSTIFSINPHTSLWGYYSRFHGGLVSTLAYTLLYYALVSNLAKKDLKIIINSIIASGLLVSLYAVAERLGIDKNLWVQDVQSRVFSTLGQPNWLSAYLVALLPLPIYLGLSSGNLRSKIYYLTSALIYFSAILFTRSRSGIGATGVILALISIHQLFINKHHNWKLVVGGLAITATIVAVVGTPWSPSPAEISRRLYVGGPLWPEIEQLLKPLDLTTQVKPLDYSRISPENIRQLDAQAQGVRYGGSDSADIRRVVWQGAFALFGRRPLLGTGVETFAYSYYWTRPAAHNLLSEWDFLYNKAHNEYLNFLATTGAVGLASYLFLAGSIFYLIFKNRNSDINTALLLGFVSILITNYFGFSVVIIGVYFFLFPAISIISSSENFPPKLAVDVLANKSKQKGYHLHPTPEQYFGFIAIGLVVLAWWWMIIAHWGADTKFNRGKQLLDAGYVGQALPELEQAVKLYPAEPTFRATLAEGYSAAALAVSQQFVTLPKEQQASSQATFVALRNSYMQKSVEQITSVIKANPWHLNFLKSKTKIELTLAQLEPTFEHNALDTLLRANELAPTDAKILYNIGLIQLELGQKDAARTAFSKAVELKSDYFQAQQQLNSLK